MESHGLEERNLLLFTRHHYTLSTPTKYIKAPPKKNLEGGVSGKGRHRSGDVGGSDVGHDSNHSKAAYDAMVQFGLVLCHRPLSSSSVIVLCHDRYSSSHSHHFVILSTLRTIVELTVPLGSDGCGINSTEVDRREDDGWEVSALSVVDALRLGNDFRNEDCEENLGLASVGDGIPRVEGLHGREGLEGGPVGKLPGEMETGSLNNVPSGCKHSNASMLELSGTEPKEGLRVGRL